MASRKILNSWIPAHLSAHACVPYARNESCPRKSLGKMIKVNRNFVGEVERGKQNICLDNILQLARAFKVSPRDFFDLYKK